MSVDTPSAVEAGLSWLETAVDSGCTNWTFQDRTRDAVRRVLRHTRDEAGPDAAQTVAERLAERARAGRPPSATQARVIAREVVRNRGHEISMASPLARSNNK